MLLARTIVVLAVVAALVVTSDIAALAHERRQIGPYVFVVGFNEEPALVGGVNGVQLRVTDGRATPPKPVEGLEKSVSVDVGTGGLATVALTFRAVFGQPGLYVADFIPTREGAYIFRIKGKVEQLDVDERFESGPGRFDEVRPVTALQYPERVPTAGDLNRALGDIRGAADQARLVGIAAFVAAAAALGLAIRARAQRRP